MTSFLKWNMDETRQGAHNINMNLLQIGKNMFALSKYIPRRLMPAILKSNMVGMYTSGQVQTLTFRIRTFRFTKVYSLTPTNMKIYLACLIHSACQMWNWIFLRQNHDDAQQIHKTMDMSCRDVHFMSNSSACNNLIHTNRCNTI